MAVANPRGARRRPMRLLTAVPVCDGHDSAVTTINLELARDGAEVIYLGYHCAASAIARAAVQEDVDAVGLSSYNGGHRVFFREVIRQLRARGAGDIPVFGGGGGTITAADERLMKGDGVDRIFPAGTSLDDILKEIRSRYGGRKAGGAAAAGDRALGRALTLAEAGKGRLPRRPSGGKPAFVVGVGGPGGAGKSTLIDELTARFLAQGGQGRIAILANDPSHPDSGGAILGDRVSAIYARDERVFFRSMATRGSPTGMSAAAAGAVALLRACGEFEYVFVESVGLGQDGDPFRVFGPGPRLVDAALFVLSPHYGGRIQLQKIAMLNGADLVALNKCDQPAAVSARVEIAGRLAMNRNGQELHETVAAQHDDPGTDRLFLAIAALRGTAPAHAA